MISIRLYKNEDKNDVFSVYKECEDFLSLGPLPIASNNMVEEDLRYSINNNGRFCVILYGDRVIGIVDYIPFGYKDKLDNSYISLLMVAKNYRNKGIGSVALIKVEEIIKKNLNIKNIYTSVQTNNTKALLFWIRQGYIRISEAELQEDTTIVYHFKKDIY